MENERRVEQWNAQWVIVAGRAAPAAWKAKHWRSAKAPFSTPRPVQPATWKAIIRGQRCTTFSTERGGELLLRFQSLY